MSSEALAWAIRAKITRSATKNLLMIVADLANHVSGEVFASIAYLEEATGLSKKTVIAALQELESPEMGVLERTGEMRGRTAQIPCYIFVMSDRVPMIARRGGKTPPFREGVEKRPERGANFPAKEGQKRHTEPSNRNQEGNQNPPLPSVEAPRAENHDLLGDIVPADSRTADLIDHVMAGWKALHAKHDRIQVPRMLNDSRKKKIAARAAEVVAGSGGVLTAIDVWDQMFKAIAGNPFLRGDLEPGKAYRDPFSLSIDYILRPAEFIRTLEKAQTDADDASASSDPDTGRRYGPAEQAMRNALARICPSE